VAGFAAADRLVRNARTSSVDMDSICRPLNASLNRVKMNS